MKADFTLVLLLKEGNVLFNDALNIFYMASYIWQRTIQIAREETRCRHYMGYSFRLAAEGLLYAPPTQTG